MRTFLLMLALLAGSTVGDPRELPQEKTHALWSAACEVPRYSCEDLEPPEVVFKKIEAPYVWGYYIPGSRAVVMNDRFVSELPQGVFFEGVVVHEMLHYLAFWSADFEIILDKCRDEGQAWLAYNVYVTSQDREDLINWYWQEAYEGCR